MKESLHEISWEEGKVVTVAQGSYRHRLVIHCTEGGRQKAVFADGQEHKYAGYFEFVNAKDEWIKQGAGMVPVLPDNRFIMVVEQRPAQSRFPVRPTVAKIAGREVDLRAFGPHSSLEFPGGAVEPGQGLKSGFIAELTDETGIPDQSALWYSCLRPICPYGSDLALEQYFGVVFLSGFKYEPYVAEDGGLQVFALNKDEVEYNIHKGVIRSGQAALLQWFFYKEVRRARIDPAYEKTLREDGYLAVEEVKIVKLK